MHFRLQPYCRLVEGAAKSAIYNFQTGKVLSINKSAANIITECHKNVLDEKQQEHWLPFLEKLCTLGLGSFYVNPTAIVSKQKKPHIDNLDFLWLELTSACNNRCLHCYTDSKPSSAENNVSHDCWLNIIKEAAALGAKAIQLIGGEPLLYPRWRELVIAARQQRFDYIEIFTNATLIDKDCIDFFKKNRVHIATTLYADNAAIHDTVTQNPGSFTKTMAAIHFMLAAKVPLRIASILMKANQNEADNIMKLLQELGVEPTPPDIIRPTGRGDDQKLLPENYTLAPIQPPFFTDQETFDKLHTYHSCLAGKVAITSEGDVIPCIFARNRVCGNILASSLTEILAGPLIREVWTTTKDCVNKCKDCEYRYACQDCRPQAQGSDPDKNWLACHAGCNYDPYTGKWKEQQPDKLINTSKTVTTSE